MARDPDLVISPSPHIKAPEGARSIMLDVIIALMPALAISVYLFGPRALTLTALSVAGSVFFEWLYRRLMKKPSSIRDLTAVITGILIAFSVPVSAPYWLVLLGDLFGIVVVKQLFGGFGKNFMNPAAAAAVFISTWSTLTTRWVEPYDYIPVFSVPSDLPDVTTPIEALHDGILPQATDIFHVFLGQTAGCIGQTSALLLFIGGIYLVLRKVITPRIPIAFLGTVAALTFIFPLASGNLTWMLYSLSSGSLMLGAVFMATDYTTSPVTSRGQWIYGAACGAITVFIRYFGAHPEGVYYAILIMNVLALQLDKFGMPRRFGTARKKISKKKEAQSDAAGE